MPKSKAELAAEASSLAQLAAEIARCRGCPLWERATQAVGPKIRVLADRGRFFDSAWGARVLVTVHPSSILRVPPEDRAKAFALFVEDLARLRRI